MSRPIAEPERTEEVMGSRKPSETYSDYLSRLMSQHHGNDTQYWCTIDESYQILRYECPQCEPGVKARCADKDFIEHGNSLYRKCIARSQSVTTYVLNLSRAYATRGDRFGRLTVVDVQKDSSDHWIATCMCTCGRTVKTRIGELTARKRISCGKCIQKNRYAEQYNTNCIYNNYMDRVKLISVLSQAVSHYVDKVGQSVVIRKVTPPDESDDGKWHAAEHNAICACGGRIRYDSRHDRVCENCCYVRGE